MTTLVLARGDVAPGARLTIELIQKLPGQASVLITWPSHITECSPSKLAEVVSNASRLLGNANLELARRRIVPEQS